MTFKELEDRIEKEGFGLNHYQDNIYFSNGIKLYIEQSKDDAKKVRAALDRFLDLDFGDFYEEDETPQLFYEYGQYPSSYGTEPNDGAIMVHKNGNGIISIYFQFER